MIRNGLKVERRLKCSLGFNRANFHPLYKHSYIVRSLFLISHYLIIRQSSISLSSIASDGKTQYMIEQLYSSCRIT